MAFYGCGGPKVEKSSLFNPPGLCLTLLFDKTDILYNHLITYSYIVKIIVLTHLNSALRRRVPESCCFLPCLGLLQEREKDF